MSGEASPIAGLGARLAPVLRSFLGRLREPSFWAVQVGVGVIALAHLLADSGLLGHVPLETGLHHIPVALYLAPVSYASLKYGLEGGVLTGVWSAVLSVPNIVLWHRASLEWIGETALLLIVLGLGAVMAVPVERERAERRRAEEASHRLALLTRQVTRAQEEERKRIARELHDDAAQQLVYLCRGLDDLADLWGRRGEEARVKLEDLRRHAGETLERVRQFSRDLRPAVLDDLGLVAALEWLTADLGGRTGMEALFRVSGQPRRLSTEEEVAIFRIVQEALRNVERHAGASRVWVEAWFDEERVRVLVADDGKGFDLEALERSRTPFHLGILGMKERAQLVGGTLHIEAEPGKGTTVRVEVPS